MKKIIMCLLSVFSLLLCGCGTAKQNYPNRNVNFIVAYKAGSGQDVTARALQSSLENALGEKVIITNNEGGSGVIGFTYTANAKPDGYTIGMSALSSLCINNVMGELEKDPRDAYDFIGGTCVEINAICTSVDSEFETLADVIEYAKNNSKQLSYAVTGATSADTVLGLEVERCAGITFKKVDYDGSADALAAVLGGHIDLMGGTVSEMLSYEEAGQIRILAVAEADGVHATFEEQGVPISFSSVRRCIVAPKGLPEDVHQALVDAVKQAVESDDFIAKAEAAGQNPEYATPEQLLKETDSLMDALQTFDNKK